MNLIVKICSVTLPALTMVLLMGCVSKQEYLMKVEESERSINELETLRSEYHTLRTKMDNSEKEKTDLKVRIVSLKQEIDRLQEERTNLEEILESESSLLGKQVSELRSKNNRLKQENENLLTKVTALEVERDEEVQEMRRTYDDLLVDMRAEIDKGKITITQLEGKLKVDMVDEILFDSGETTIKPEGIQVLERVGKVLLNVKDQTINIAGHTDNVPIGPDLVNQYPTNWELSAARATSVARYLQDICGIDPRLISATGYGQYQPIESNKTEKGRARNRRIEIVLVPKEITPTAKK
ncbi:MAG: OmpA family protein [Deltaproteobacteria bacterium]|nr:OmpA family protein [Deltaproteobacteria bacterium]